jgi:hypothetical protein
MNRGINHILGSYMQRPNQSQISVPASYFLPICCPDPPLSPYPANPVCLRVKSLVVARMQYHSQLDFNPGLRIPLTISIATKHRCTGHTSRWKKQAQRQWLLRASNTGWQIPTQSISPLRLGVSTDSESRSAGQLFSTTDIIVW